MTDVSAIEPPLAAAGQEPFRPEATAVPPRPSAVRALTRRLGSFASILTPLGRLVAGVGVVSWIVGWRLGWAEFLLAAATCLLLLVVGVAFAFGRMNVDVGASMDPARVVVGQTASGQMSAVNNTRRRVLGLRVELLVGAAVAQFDIPILSASGAHHERFIIPTHRRAVIAVGPARTLRGDPLGLWRRTMAWPTVTNLYIHPKTSVLEGFGAGLLRDMEGRTTNDTSTSDVELHTLRDYVPGDDRRYVHWRTSARSGRLMVRQFVDTRRSQVAVVLSGEVADYANDDEFELAVSVVASLGVRAVRDQQPISIIAAGRPLPTMTVVSVLDGASGAELGAARTGLSDSAAQLLHRTPDVTLALLITGSTTSLAAIRAAAARFGPDVAVVVFRAHIGGTPGLRKVGTTHVATLAALLDLPRLVRAVS